MDTSKEKIIEKITKLLALANNEASSEGERDNALRMANNLLLKHNIEMLEVEEFEKEENREEVILDFYQMNWTQNLCNYVAKLFFCKYLIGHKINATKGRHLFFGKSSNAITAKLMSEYLITSILRECRRNWKHNLCPESRSFSVGATDAICRRVTELLNAQQESFETDTKNALVLKDYYKTELEKNTQFIESFGFKLKKKNTDSSKNLVGSAYFEGKQFGGNVSLNNQVSSSKSKPLLLT